jgi:hypothetical protein
MVGKDEFAETMHRELVTSLVVRKKSEEWEDSGGSTLTRTEEWAV